MEAIQQVNDLKMKFLELHKKYRQAGDLALLPAEDSSMDSNVESLVGTSKDELVEQMVDILVDIVSVVNSELAPKSQDKSTTKLTTSVTAVSAPKTTSIKTNTSQKVPQLKEPVAKCLSTAVQMSPEEFQKKLKSGQLTIVRQVVQPKTQPSPVKTVILPSKSPKVNIMGTPLKSAHQKIVTSGLTKQKKGSLPTAPIIKEVPLATTGGKSSDNSGLGPAAVMRLATLDTKATRLNGMPVFKLQPASYDAQREAKKRLWEQSVVDWLRKGSTVRGNAFTEEQRKDMYEFYKREKQKSICDTWIFDMIARKYSKRRAGSLDKTHAVGGRFLRIIKEGEKGNFEPKRTKRQPSKEAVQKMVEYARANPLQFTLRQLSLKFDIDYRKVHDICRKNEIKWLTPKERRALKMQMMGLEYKPWGTPELRAYTIAAEKARKERRAKGDLTDGRSARHKDPNWKSVREELNLPAHMRCYYKEGREEYRLLNEFSEQVNKGNRASKKKNKPTIKKETEGPETGEDEDEESLNDSEMDAETGKQMMLVRSQQVSDGAPSSSRQVLTLDASGNLISTDPNVIIVSQAPSSATTNVSTQMVTTDQAGYSEYEYYTTGQPSNWETI